MKKSVSYVVPKHCRDRSQVMFNWCQVMSIWLGKPLLKCVVSIWALPVRLARMVWGTFFPRCPGCLFVVVRMFWCTFFHVCPFARGGGGLKLFEQCPYRIKTFKKGASLTMWSQDELSTREYLCFIRSVIKHKSLGFDLDDLSTVAGI